MTFNAPSEADISTDLTYLVSPFSFPPFPRPDCYPQRSLCFPRFASIWNSVSAISCWYSLYKFSFVQSGSEMGSLSQMPSQPSSSDDLEHALQRAHEEYSNLHPQSQKSYENACKYLPGGNTRTVLHTTPFPFTVASAYGCMVKSLDGLEYTDFLGEYTAGIYGHNNPIIRGASSV